ncbi:MAG: hypothetical protein ACXVCY_15825 [Pseudobdellovibrionaceae bacterium]
MATIQCKIEIPSLEGLRENELTVGREFLLGCDGDFPKNLVQEKLSFVLKPEQKYQIQLLGFEFRSQTRADLKVTAYKAGPAQFQDLQLTDGTQTLSLGPIQYTVQSVIQPSSGQQQAKQEPYGPIGPASMSVPVFYWAILGGICSLVVLFFVAKIYRYVQRRNILERLKEHDSAQSPLAQFHQSLRRLQRTNTVFFGGKAEKSHITECLDETYKMLKLYLTRRFQVPAMEWSHRLVLKDIKKYHPKIYQEHSAELEKLFKEYHRGIQDKENLKEDDVLVITKHCRVLVEKMERIS